MASVSGVFGTGLSGRLSLGAIQGVTGLAGVGNAYVAGSVLVSLYSDNAGVPGSLIAVLGTISDGDVSGQTRLSLPVNPPIALAPLTRYWLQLHGNSQTDITWVQLADAVGTGVPNEFWYKDADHVGLESDGGVWLLEDGSGAWSWTAQQSAANDGAYQMGIFGDQSSLGVYGTGLVGGLSEPVFDTIAGVAGLGQAGVFHASLTVFNTILYDNAFNTDELRADALANTTISASFSTSPVGSSLRIIRLVLFAPGEDIALERIGEIMLEDGTGFVQLDDSAFLLESGIGDLLTEDGGALDVDNGLLVLQDGNNGLLTEDGSNLIQ